MNNFLPLTCSQNLAYLQLTSLTQDQHSQISVVMLVECIVPFYLNMICENKQKKQNEIEEIKIL